MKTEKTINLTAYMVEYIDQREPKPRTVHTQTVVLDGGKISALARLDMRPAGLDHPAVLSGTATQWPASTRARPSPRTLTWPTCGQQTAAQIERGRLKAQLQAALAQLNREETEVEA